MEKLNKTFWPMILSYMMIVHSISCIIYTMNIFEEWANAPSSISLLIATLVYLLFAYVSLSVTVVCLAAWKKGGFKNLDKIKDHGIIWYFGSFLIGSLVASILTALIISSIISMLDYDTFYAMFEMFISTLIMLSPLVILSGFISAATLGLIYEFGKEER